MSPKRAVFDLDHAIEEYGKGKTVLQVANELRIGKGVLYRRFNNLGITRSRRLPLDEKAIKAAYLAGESEKALAERYGVSRTPIRRVLLDNGIEPRDRSASMYTRMSKTTRAERLRLTAAAHAAVRGVPHSIERKLAKAQWVEANWETRATAMELKLGGWLKDRGIKVRFQKAIGPYNCDIAGRPVAVEIFGGGWHFSGRHLARTPERIRYLLDSGWHVVMVHVYRSAPLTDAVADYLATYIKRARRHPAEPREYRVIRRAGELVARGGLDNNEIRIRPSPRHSDR